jgi:hypothetical protein
MRVNLRKPAAHSLPTAIGSLPNKLGRCLHGGSPVTATSGAGTTMAQLRQDREALQRRVEDLRMDLATLRVKYCHSNL